MYNYNNHIETISPRKLADLQIKRLRGILKYAYENSPEYKQKWDAAKVDIRKIGKTGSLDDIKKLPVTEKSDLPIKGNGHLVSVSPQRIVTTQQSNGNTSTPLNVPLTQNDLNRLAKMSARSLRAAGIEPGDKIQNAYALKTLGSTSTYYGSQALGTNVVLTTDNSPREQVNIMNSEKPTGLTCSASYAYSLCEEAQSMGLEPNDISWKVALLGTEPYSDDKRNYIEEKLGVKTYDVYGLSEAGGLGIAAECDCKNGLHVCADLYYPEILAKDGEIAGEGEEGELLLTTLSRGATPLIRYNTHDITSISYEKCECGRTMPTINKIKRPSDDMLTVKGVNIYPAKIKKVWQKLANEGLISAEGCQICVLPRGRSEELEIRICPERMIDNVNALMTLKNIATDEMSRALKITPLVSLSEPLYLHSAQPNAKKVINLRNSMIAKRIGENCGRDGR